MDIAKRSAWLAATCLGIVSAAIAAPPAPRIRHRARAAQPTTRPAKIPDVFDDAWLVQIAYDEFGRTIENGDYAGLTETLRRAMLERMACGKVRLATMQHLVYVWRAARYLPQSQSLPKGKEFRGISFATSDSRRRCSALSPTGSSTGANSRPGTRHTAGEPMRRMYELVAAEPKATVAYAELAVAFCVTHPSWRTPKPATMLQSFRWYVYGDVKFRYDLRKMPYELSCHLAASRLNLAERAWAVKTYKGLSEPAKSYGRVPYDSAHFRNGEPKKISAHAYTMMNLTKYGGVCNDQAYFASEVCRVLGIPAAYVIGSVDSGIGHAWVAYLRVDRGAKRIEWDADVGRIGKDDVEGKVVDPRTGKNRSEGEMSLDLASLRIPLDDETSRGHDGHAGVSDRAVGRPTRPDRTPAHAEISGQALRRPRRPVREAREPRPTGWRPARPSI